MADKDEPVDQEERMARAVAGACETIDGLRAEVTRLRAENAELHASLKGRTVSCGACADAERRARLANDQLEHLGKVHAAYRKVLEPTEDNIDPIAMVIGTADLDAPYGETAAVVLRTIAHRLDVPTRLPQAGGSETEASEDPSIDAALATELARNQPPATPALREALRRKRGGATPGEKNAGTEADDLTALFERVASCTACAPDRACPTHASEVHRITGTPGETERVEGEREP